VDREHLLNGRIAWELLELYNDVARAVGREQDVLVVDLARRLPKSSRLFYDFVHFTNEGSAQVAAIAEETVCPLLARRFPRYVTSPCKLAR
jgi:hypothetical protein